MMLTWGLLVQARESSMQSMRSPCSATGDSRLIIRWPARLIRACLTAKVRPTVGRSRRAQERDVADRVHFQARFLPTAALGQLIGGADVVLLPYDSLEQVTSGVLIEAVTAGKPVVSTCFPHAMELLGGAGCWSPVRTRRASPTRCSAC